MLYPYTKQEIVTLVTAAIREAGEDGACAFGALVSAALHLAREWGWRPARPLRFASMLEDAVQAFDEFDAIWNREGRIGLSRCWLVDSTAYRHLQGV